MNVLLIILITLSAMKDGYELKFKNESGKLKYGYVSHASGFLLTFLTYTLLYASFNQDYDMYNYIKFMSCAAMIRWFLFDTIHNVINGNTLDYIGNVALLDRVQRYVVNKLNAPYFFLYWLKFVWFFIACSKVSECC